MNDLILEYRKGKRALEQVKSSLDADNPEHAEKLKIINSMIEDMRYAIEWMKTGKRPRYYGGVEHKSAYDYSRLMNMDLLPDVYIEQGYTTTIPETKRNQVAKMMMLMSEREMSCYLLHFSYGYSLQRIADEFKVSKSTVQTNLNRAKNKVKSVLSYDSHSNAH